MQCTGLAAWRTAFLYFLQWVCCGALQPASLQMAVGIAMLVVPLSVQIFQHVVERSSCLMRCCSARLWFGLYSRPLLSRTRCGPVAWSHAQCELLLAVYESPAQVSSPGPRFSIHDISAYVPQGGCAAILDGVSARVAHPSLCLFDGHMVNSTVCPLIALLRLPRRRLLDFRAGHDTMGRQCEYGYMGMHYGPSVIV